MEMRMHAIKQEHTRNTGTLQIPLDEDRNISDIKPDARKIIFYQGNVQLDEVKNGNNKIWVKGKLKFQILYQTDQSEPSLEGMQGEIPFMEEMNVGFEETDQLCVTGKVDSLKIHIINSRKFSIQSILSLEARVYIQKEVQLCNGTQEKSGLELLMKEVPYLESVITKKDVYRIHEEQTLPGEFDQMEALLWSSMQLKNMTYRPLNDKIGISGEMALFLVMREEESQQERFYETTIPVSGILDCIGCKENMILRIEENIQDLEIQLREKTIHAEFALDMCLRLFENRRKEALQDMYGTQFEVALETQKDTLIALREEGKIEERMQETIHLDGEKPFAVLHFEPRISWTKLEKNQKGCTILGEMSYVLLYQDAIGYDLKEGAFPFQIKKDLILEEEDVLEHTCQIVAQSISLQEQEISCSFTLRADYLLTRNLQLELIRNATISPFQKETLQTIPGIGVYYVSNQDTLWKIGKEYHIGVDKIREINELTKEEVTKGDVLIIAQAK